MTETLAAETLIYDLKWASNPAPSPDGRLVVYEVTTTDRATKKGSTHLWLADVETRDSRQVTRAGTFNGGAAWSPDGARIAFLSDRGKGTGLFVLPPGGGDAREIARHRGAAGGLAWSPDGRSLAYAAVVDPANPDDEEPKDGAPAPIRATRRSDYKQDGRGWLGDARSQVFIVDVESGARRQLTTEPLDHNHPTWSPDGRTIAAFVPSDNYVVAHLALIDVATGATTMVGEERGFVGCWAWSPDGKRLLLGAEPAKTFHLDFLVYDVETKTSRQLTTDLHPELISSWSIGDRPHQPVWRDDRHVRFSGAESGKSGLYELDCETGAVQRLLLADGQHFSVSADAAGNRFAFSLVSFEAAGEIVVHDLKANASHTVSRLNVDLLDQLEPLGIEQFTIERDGLSIDAWLLTPPGFDPANRYPLVLDIHGGPNWWYGPDFNFAQQLLAHHGFLVVFANPRGSSSYGRNFAHAVAGDWGGGDYADLMAVVDEVLKRPYVDPARAGVWGYSYGGYMTALTIGRTNRFKAAVIGAPVVDLASFFGTSDFAHAWGPLQWNGKPWEIAGWIGDRSPIARAHLATTSALILHAEGDERCPIGQSEQLFAALKAGGCEAEFVRYPGGHHGFLWGGEPVYVEDAFRRLLEWFQRHLQPAS